MARSRKDAYERIDAEKRGLMQVIQQGKTLPEQYRFVLFEDKREVELVRNGMTREVCTTILPFHSSDSTINSNSAGKSQRLAGAP